MLGQRRELDGRCFLKILLILPGLKFSLTWQLSIGKQNVQFRNTKV